MLVLPWLACRPAPPPVPGPVTLSGPGEDSGLDSAIAPAPVGWGSCGAARDVLQLPSSSELSDTLPASDGGRYVVGTTEDALALGGGATVVPAGEAASWVARYASDDTVDWVDVLDGGAIAGVAGIIDAGDGIAIAGAADAATAIAGTPVGSDRADGFLASLSADGAVRWVRRFASSGFDAAQALAAGPDGGVVVAGTFSGPMALGTGDHAQVVLDLGDARTASGAFLVRYGPDGALRWAVPAFLAEGRVDGVAYDPVLDAVYLAGRTEYRTALVTGTTGRLPVGPGVAFLARFDGDGALSWVAPFGGTNTALVREVQALPGAGVVLGGAFTTLSLDGAPTVAQGDQDAWAAAYDPDGAVRWLVHGAAGLDEYAEVSSIAVRPDGTAVLVGVWQDHLTLGDTVLADVAELSVEQNGFVAPVGPSGAVGCVLGLGAGPEDTFLTVAAARMRPDGWLDLVGSLYGRLELGAGVVVEVDDRVGVALAVELDP